jgi:hypothetical protein
MVSKLRLLVMGLLAAAEPEEGLAEEVLDLVAQVERKAAAAQEAAERLVQEVTSPEKLVGQLLARLLNQEDIVLVRFTGFVPERKPQAISSLRKILGCTAAEASALLNHLPQVVPVPREEWEPETVIYLGFSGPKSS